MPFERSWTRSACTNLAVAPGLAQYRRGGDAVVFQREHRIACDQRFEAAGLPAVFEPEDPAGEGKPAIGVGPFALRTSTSSGTA